jgi:hypothetical protein
LAIKELNEILDFVTKIQSIKNGGKKAEATSTEIETIKESETLAILQANLIELRRTYDHVSNIYDQLRIKALTFIAGEIAIVTFLFASNIKYPSLLYGQMIFWAGILSFLCSFSVLLWTIAAVQWRIPCDFEKFENMKKKFSSEIALTEYVHNEYVSAIAHCLPLVSMKSRRFNTTIYFLSVGVIIILLLKYGGPNV